MNHKTLHSQYSCWVLTKAGCSSIFFASDLTFHIQIDGGFKTPFVFSFPRFASTLSSLHHTGSSVSRFFVPGPAANIIVIRCCRVALKTDWKTWVECPKSICLLVFNTALKLIRSLAGKYCAKKAQTKAKYAVRYRVTPTMLMPMSYL